MKAVFVAALLALAAGARAAPAFADPVQAAMATPDLSTLVRAHAWCLGCRGPRQGGNLKAGGCCRRRTTGLV